MGWEIEKKKAADNKTVEIFNGHLDDRPRVVWYDTYQKFGGPLAYIYPEDADSKTCMYSPRAKTLETLKLIRDKWGDNAIVSFKEIATFLSERSNMHKIKVAHALNLLWRAGYLRKLVAGRHGRGNFHGVHYEIIPR